MIEVDYEKLTIENAQYLYKTRYITGIEFNADNKKAKIREDEYKKIEDNFKEIEKSVKEIANVICKSFKQKWNSFKITINKTLNKKITKKRFIKLLQSEGIQRNTINDIIKNNKEPYTYLRYYLIINGGTYE